MKKFFHKLDKRTASYLIHKRKANGLFLIFLGVLWGMEIAGWFNQIPNHEYFIPAVLVVAGLFEIVRAHHVDVA